MDFPITMPSKIEQVKIGEYFRDIDKLITLHQRKCDEIKTLKKYMLQKMFPQNGMNVPVNLIFIFYLNIKHSCI